MVATVIPQLRLVGNVFAEYWIGYMPFTHETRVRIPIGSSESIV